MSTLAPRPLSSDQHGEPRQVVSWQLAEARVAHAPRLSSAVPEDQRGPCSAEVRKAST